MSAQAHTHVSEPCRRQSHLDTYIRESSVGLSRGDQESIPLSCVHIHVLAHVHVHAYACISYMYM